jgi:hypothetical protein
MGWEFILVKNDDDGDDDDGVCVCVCVVPALTLAGKNVRASSE